MLFFNYQKLLPQPKGSKGAHVEMLRRYISDIVYGSTDGIITTFVVVSGVEGAKLPYIVVIVLGVVNLFADGLSMGASSFLSMRAGTLAQGSPMGVKQPFYHATITFFAFVLIGAIPLMSFLIPGFEQHQFTISCILTALALFFVGSLRRFISKERWYQGGLEMLVIGGIAAVIAYGLGYLLSLWIA